MAVPKQKQSHARTNKRRSQHKISAPTINECPQCHARAARTACARTAAPTPAVRSSRPPSPTTSRPRVGGPRAMSEPVTVAVDANGADLGPAEVAAGAALAAATRRPRARCSARPPSSATCPTASRWSTRRSRSPRRPSPHAPSARRPRPRSSRPPGPSADGRAPTRWSRPAPPARPSPRACSTSARGAASTARRSPCRSPSRARRCLLLDVGANVESRARAPRPVRLHGRGLRRGGARCRASRGSACSPTARSRARARRTCSRPTRSSPRAPRCIDFVGNVEGTERDRRAPPTSSSPTASPATWR